MIQKSTQLPCAGLMGLTPNPLRRVHLDSVPNHCMATWTASRQLYPSSHDSTLHFDDCASLSTISSSFNLLFKVLFTFPSQYFFAIGLLAIFSFRCGLTPLYLGLQSQTARLETSTPLIGSICIGDLNEAFTLCGYPFHGLFITSMQIDVGEHLPKATARRRFYRQSILSLSSSIFTRRY